MKNLVWPIIWALCFILGWNLDNIITTFRGLIYPPVQTTQVCKYVTDLFQENGRWMVDSAIDSCHRVKWEGRA